MEPNTNTTNASVENAPLPPPPSKSREKLIIGALLIVIILLIGVGTGYLYLNRESKDPNLVPSPTPTTSPTPGFVNLETQTYINEEENWQLELPQDLKIETHSSEQIGPNGLGSVVVFSKLGPTQSEGTEFYDGISFTVGLKKKEAGQSIMEFADKDSAPDPEISTRTPLKAITINGHKGYETTVSGLGTVRLIYLEYPVLEDRVYYIAIFSEGPGESKQEYDDIVSKMLSSFKSYR